MLRKCFLETVRLNGMDRLMEQSGVVIAAFSGGADSSALLHLLSDYSAERGLCVVAAHVNHMIRGEEADEDERFVRETAERLRFPIHVKRVDVPSLAKEQSIGIEEAARKVRYAFFEELSEQYGGAPVATAHNSDDNLETVLHHLVRGSGLKGLCGIAPVRDGKYIRPLIACSAKEIREFCGTKGIPYRIDSTNADTGYTRNYIRHRVVPALGGISDSPKEAVSRLTELLRRDSDYLEAEALRICPRGTADFPREELNRLHPALSARILRNMHEAFSAESAGSAEYVHVRAMLDLASSEKKEGSVTLPGGVVFRVTRRAVFFASSVQEKKGSEGEAFRFPMNETGSIFENERYKITVSPNEHKVCTQEYENIYKLSIHKILCSDKIIGSLYIKYRNQGDTYRYGGMTRKVKKLMIDQKLTAEEKRLLPLLCDDGGIVWMPRCPLRDGVEGNECEGQRIHVYFFEKY